MRRTLTGLLATLALSPLAHAHSELPTATWCQQGQAVVVSNFEFLPATLIERRNAEQQCLPTGDGEKTCGQFDDDYGTGRRMALRACGLHAAQNSQGDIGTVIYMVDYPQSFNGDDHHAVFRAEHGLRGSCVRCERRNATPALPQR